MKSKLMNLMNRSIVAAAFVFLLAPGHIRAQALRLNYIWTDNVLAEAFENIEHFTPDPERRKRLAAEILETLRSMSGEKNLRLIVKETEFAQEKTLKKRSACTIYYDKDEQGASRANIELPAEMLDNPKDAVAKAFAFESALYVMYSNSGWIDDEQYRTANFLSLFSTMEILRARTTGVKKKRQLEKYFEELNNALYPNVDSASARRRMSRVPIFVQYLEACLYCGRTGKDEDPRIENQTVLDALSVTKTAREILIKAPSIQKSYEIMRDEI